MKLGNRIFPYPVLNNDPELSSFIGKNFSLVFTENEKNFDTFILEDVRFESDVKIFEALYKAGGIDVILIVECPKTAYRKTFLISDKPRTLKLPKRDLEGTLEISAYAYAKRDFTLDPSKFDPSDSVEEIYKQTKFKIKKYYILACDDGYRFNFTQDNKGNAINSIFSVIPDENIVDKKYILDFANPNKITVLMSNDSYDKYKVLNSAMTQFNELMHSLLLIPALSQAFSEIKNKIMVNNYLDYDDVINNYTWFSSVLYSYKKNNNEEELTIEKFCDYNPIELAQKIVNYPFLNALTELETALNNGGFREE